jgi:hypothetical protein
MHLGTVSQAKKPCKHKNGKGIFFYVLHPENKTEMARITELF